MSASPTGYLTFVLHAHLPFIRHPEVPDFLEEDWFFEGVVETYGPLLRRFEQLRSEGIRFRVTMTVTPPLAAMMGDELLRDRLALYINNRIGLLKKEVHGASNPHVKKLAEFYLAEFEANKDFIFNRHHGSVLNSLRSLQDSGHIEIITCTATHGFIPLMGNRSAWKNQVETAARSHEQIFGRRPRGIWLAECGYEAGIDDVLAESGIEYTFVDSHGIMFGDPQPVQGVYAPVITDAGLNVFARDPESSKQVWSQKEGYPGDTVYREFYRDLGWDANYDYIKPYLHSDGVKRGVGIKYHKITGNIDLSQKEFYDPYIADQKAAEHAGNFMFNRQAQVRFLRDKTTYPPIIISPYDAELFGHWWFEGPQFLEYLIRKIACDQSEIELITCGDYLDRHPIRQLQKPNPSTWGSEGHNLVWLNGGNAWLYRHQHWAEKKFLKLVQQFPHAQGDLKRALKQLQRELLLLQSSDWAFIMTTGTTVSYATRRFREHLHRFQQIAEEIEGNRINMKKLSDFESRAPIFSNAEPNSAAV